MMVPGVWWGSEGSRWTGPNGEASGPMTPLVGDQQKLTLLLVPKNGRLGATGRQSPPVPW